MFTIQADFFNSAEQISAIRSTHARIRRSRLLPSGISALLVFLLSACSGGSDPVIVSDSPNVPLNKNLTVEPASFIMREGAQISLKGKLGSTAIGASQLSWAVSPSDVATIDAYGNLTALKHGEAVVTARYTSLSATAQATVWPIPRRIEAVTTLTQAGIVGRPLPDSLAVRALGGDGAPAPGVNFHFEVLSGDGILSHATRQTGLDGIARIDWKLGTVAGGQQLKARSPGLGELDFAADALADYDSATVVSLAGDAQEAVVTNLLPEALLARVTDQFGNLLPGLAVEWSFSDGGGLSGYSGNSGNPQPALVSTTDAQGMTQVQWQLGTVAGLQEAVCAPPAAGVNGVAGNLGGNGPSGSPAHDKARGKKWTARAEPADPNNVLVTPGETWTVVGEPGTLSAAVVDPYGNVISGNTFIWRADNSGVVQVDGGGNIVGLKVGTGQVTAESTALSLSGSAVVIVESRRPSKLNRGSGNGQKGKVAQTLPNPLRVQVLDQVGAPVAGVEVRWTIGQTASGTGGSGSSPVGSPGQTGTAVTVTDQNGFAQNTWTLGTQAGNQTLQAAVEGVAGVEFTAQATPDVAVSISVEPSSTSLEIGQTRQFTSSAKDAFENPVTQATFEWGSSNPAAATVNSSGLVTGLAAGSTEITVSVDGVSASAALTVSAQVEAVTSVQVSPGTKTLVGLDKTTTLTATAQNSLGETVSDATFAWTSLNPTIATVSQGGVVTSKALGQALIVVSAACCSASDTAIVIVEQSVVVAPVVTTVSPMPNGLVGSSYNAPLEATGGEGGYSWALSGGTTLPAGLSLNGTTGEITGTPAAPGTKTFSVQVTSGGQTATKQLSITISTPTQTITGDTIELKVTRLAGGTGEVLVSSGIPLTPGLLRPNETGRVAVVVGGVEQSIFVAGMPALHQDGSLRTILVQFRSNVGSTPLSGQLIVGPNVTRATVDIPKTTVTWAVPNAVVLPTRADYLVGTDIVGKTITKANMPGSPSVLADYERNFIQYGDTHWAAEQPGTGAGSYAWNFYDRALVWFAWWARTGNIEYWIRGAAESGAYQDVVDDSQMGNLPPPRNQQLEGLELRFLLVGDDVARRKLVAIAELDHVIWSPVLDMNPSSVWLEGRIQARTLMAHLMAWRIGDTSKDWRAIAREDLSSILSTQRADGSYGDIFLNADHVDAQGIGMHVPYMVGLVHDAFIKYYTWVEPDSRIPPAIKAALDFEWANLWVPGDASFKYQENETSGAPDLNMLSVNGYGWYYHWSRDPGYLAKGEAIFAGGVRGAWLPGYKQFNQHYRSAFRYLYYRQ